MVRCHEAKGGSPRRRLWESLALRPVTSLRWLFKPTRSGLRRVSHTYRRGENQLDKVDTHTTQA